MRNKKIWIIVIAVIVVVAIVFGVMRFFQSGTINAPLASSYTKIALHKDFSKAMNAHDGIEPGTTPLQIQQGTPQIIMNVLTYVLYAAHDYQQGKITGNQLIEVLNNTKGSADVLLSAFYKANKIVLTYPIVNKADGGNSYVETESDGTQNWNTVNFVKQNQTIMDAIQQLYKTTDPNQVYPHLQQIGVLMEQNTFNFGSNLPLGINQITIQGFKDSWITGNTFVTVKSVQDGLTSILH